MEMKELKGRSSKILIQPLESSSDDPSDVPTDAASRRLSLRTIIPIMHVIPKRNTR